MQEDYVKPSPRTNAPQMYKRAHDSVWVAIPRTTHRALAMFMLMGTWFAIRTELGDIITNGRAR